MNQTFTMKQLKSLLCAVFFCAPLTAAAQDIEINAENFPDENFRNYIFILTYGYAVDGKLTEEEIKRVTQINVNEENISSLKGIEYFTALTYLGCNNNQLTDLDVSYNTALETLYCSGNQLTDLDVSHNTALTLLSCYENQLTTLDVSHNTALTMLSCFANQLTALDVSHNSALTTLWCYNNQIKVKSMDTLISSLSEKTGSRYKYLYVYYEDSNNEGNICTKSQVSAAKAKGWMPYYHNYGGESDVWYEYEGSDDEAAGIVQPIMENGDAPVYNLAGQKVSSPVKGGIYIIGGKKVVVK